MPRYKREHVFGAAGLLIGIGTLAIGAVALMWDYRRDKHDGITGDPESPPRQPQGTAPPAQKAPVPALARAQLIQYQHWLNVIAGKHMGQPGALDEDGKPGPKTSAMVKDFQSRHGFQQTGTLDGATRSAIAADIARLTHGEGPEGSPLIAFRIVWDPNRRVWTSQDSMKFVTEIAGHVDPASPPTDQDVRDVLVQHYGPTSSVGKALLSHRYKWTCPDCP